MQFFKAWSSEGVESRPPFSRPKCEIAQGFCNYKRPLISEAEALTAAAGSAYRAVRPRADRLQV
jgi:hypothetical protein